MLWLSCSVKSCFSSCYVSFIFPSLSPNHLLHLLSNKQPNNSYSARNEHPQQFALNPKKGANSSVPYPYRLHTSSWSKSHCSCPFDNTPGCCPPALRSPNQNSQFQFASHIFHPPNCNAPYRTGAECGTSDRLRWEWRQRTAFLQLWR